MSTTAYLLVYVGLVFILAGLWLPLKPSTITVSLGNMLGTSVLITGDDGVVRKVEVVANDVGHPMLVVNTVPKNP